MIDFFTKHPAELSESVAVGMMHKKMEEAKELCDEGDENYMTHLAKSYEMLCDFFNEKNVNPDTLV